MSQYKLKLDLQGFKLITDMAYLMTRSHTAFPFGSSILPVVQPEKNEWSLTVPYYNLNELTKSIKSSIDKYLAITHLANVFY